MRNHERFREQDSEFANVKHIIISTNENNSLKGKISAIRWNIGLLIIIFFFESDYSVLAQNTNYQTYGILNNLPVFYQKMKDRMNYPLSWTFGSQGDFESWKVRARKQVFQSLLSPPPFIPFAAVTIDSVDKGTYIARKVVFNVTADSRVLAYLLVPKSPGPHPAVLLLHDHGGVYDIGKEKVIESFKVSTVKANSANSWVNIYYGGRFIGDELAKLGYVCLAVDMLNWSDRGGAGADQGAFSANMFLLGESFSGLIAYEDMQAAEFLSRLPEVDSMRIAAMGLSVGGYRTWQLAALSNHISAGVSVCWMSTYKSLIIPGANITTGAYTMLHPDLSNYLDFPDVASIACPKPMMFCNGNADPLFPLLSIEEAHAKMHTVWDSQNASDKLITKLYNAPHEFNLAMQADAFAWLDTLMHPLITHAKLLTDSKNEQSAVSVSPNPATNETVINYQLIENSKVKACLFNMSGKEIQLLFEKIQTAGNYNVTINTAKLVNATYLINFEINHKIISKKLIVYNH